MLIKMDPDVARETAGRIEQTAGIVEGQSNDMRGSVRTLMASYTGRSAGAFEARTEECVQQLQLLIEELHELGRGLRHEAEEMETVDRSF
jgi:WXG100 family type VII secretion target